MPGEINPSCSVGFSGRHAHFSVKTHKSNSSTSLWKLYLDLTALYLLHRREIIPALGRLKLPGYLCLPQLEEQSSSGTPVLCVSAVPAQAQLHAVTSLKSTEFLWPSGSKAQVPSTTCPVPTFLCLERHSDCFRKVQATSRIRGYGPSMRPKLTWQSNQLLKSVAIEHISPWCHCDRHIAVLVGRVC